MTANPCYFCNSTETKFCSICEKYLCDEHRKNYPLRLMGFLKETVNDIKDITN